MLYSKNRRNRLEELSVVVGLLAGVIVFGIFGRSLAEFRPEEAGLGEDTTAYLSNYDGLRVAGFLGEPTPVHATLRRVKASGKRVALWMGASQLHAINKISAGDELAVFYANQAAARRGADLFYVQLSDPNANLNEILVGYLQIRKEELLPDLLVLGLTYDDLREPGIRRAILERAPDPLVVEEQIVSSAGLENIEAARAMAAMREKQSLQVPDDIQGSPQQRLEEELTRLLEEYFPAYRARGKILAAAEVSMLQFFFSLRSDLTRTRIPPIPEDQKAWNLRALDTLLELAQRDGVAVLAYKAPHRPDEPIFYHDRASYDRFFEVSESRFRSERVHYADLQEIVPAEHWGFLRSGVPDVFHFRVKGHRLLGSHIDDAAMKAGF